MQTPLRLRISTLVLALATALAATGCSSSSGSGSSSSPDATQSPLYSKYCTGTLTADKKLMRAMPPAGWIGDGSLHAAAGTTFLLSIEFQRWEGYVIEHDGSAAKIDSDFTKGLVKGTDFSSDCAGDPSSVLPGAVPLALLTQATIFPNPDLTGTACKLDAGTEMKTNYGVAAFGDHVEITGDVLQQKCQMSKGYAKDLEYASPVTR